MSIRCSIPGTWLLERRGGDMVALSLASPISLASGARRIGVRIERTLRPLKMKPSDQDLTIIGYRQSVEVRQDEDVPMTVVPWIIRQVAPRGLAFLTSSPPGSASRVFGEPPEAALMARDNLWLVDMSGPGFYKTAYHRNSIGLGRLGYLRADKEGVACALLYRPDQAAARDYPEVLPHDAEAAGQAASLFYDSGRFGAYGELELYGHRDSAGHGILTTDCLFLRGPVSRVREWIGLPPS